MLLNTHSPSLWLGVGLSKQSFNNTLNILRTYWLENKGSNTTNTKHSLQIQTQDKCKQNFMNYKFWPCADRLKRATIYIPSSREIIVVVSIAKTASLTFCSKER